MGSVLREPHGAAACARQAPAASEPARRLVPKELGIRIRSNCAAGGPHRSRAQTARTGLLLLVSVLGFAVAASAQDQTALTLHEAIERAQRRRAPGRTVLTLVKGSCGRPGSDRTLESTSSPRICGHGQTASTSQTTPKTTGISDRSSSSEGNAQTASTSLASTFERPKRNGPS